MHYHHTRINTTSLLKKHTSCTTQHTSPPHHHITLTPVVPHLLPGLPSPGRVWNPKPYPAGP